MVRLASWMRAQGLGRGKIGDVEPISGGSQNILVRFTFDGVEYVLRRPPLHKRANSDDTMRREARVLAGLAGTAVPHPRLIAACSDTEVLGAAFYLMEPVEGFNALVDVPEPHRSDQAWQHAMGLDMASALAELGEVDPTAPGLADLGRPDGWPERQVERWRSQLDGYHDLPGYPAAPLFQEVDDIARWLDAHRPTTWSPGLMHGDFHLGNVLFANDSPRLAAVVDWELATIGDPLLDLGHLLATWPVARERAASTVVELPGLPTPAELVEAYAARSDRSLDHFAWYEVLAGYRLGILLEGTHARACGGKALVEIGDAMHAYARRLFGRATRRIACEEAHHG